MATPKKPMGRPKGAGRITSRYVVVATAVHQAWMREFLAHLGSPEVSDVIRAALVAYARERGFRAPPVR